MQADTFLRFIYSCVNPAEYAPLVLHASGISCRLFFQPKSSSMGIQLQIVQEADLPQFKRDMQEAFQKGAEAEFGHISEQILPESHINASLSKAGSMAYAAVEDGCIVGGAIVQINPETHHHHLDFLYVKHGVQSKGIGQAIWAAIEQNHPDAIVWETGTPYFERRNIHFYVNKCGFHIVEYYNEKHPDPYMQDEDNMPDTDPIPGFERGFFRFEKRMQ